jgi:hypothetical protein
MEALNCVLNDWWWIIDLMCHMEPDPEIPGCPPKSESRRQLYDTSKCSTYQ